MTNDKSLTITTLPLVTMTAADLARMFRALRTVRPEVITIKSLLAGK